MTKGLIALGCAVLMGTLVGACESKKPLVPDPADPSSLGGVDAGAMPATTDTAPSSSTTAPGTSPSTTPMTSPNTTPP